MKFLADANIPQSVINSLNNFGYNVLDIKKYKLSAKDVEIIRLAQKEERIILTLDKDFISLTQFPKHHVPTIVVRLQNQKSEHILERLLPLLQEQDKNILLNSLTIIREDAAGSHPY